MWDGSSNSAVLLHNARVYIGRHRLLFLFGFIIFCFVLIHISAKKPLPGRGKVEPSAIHTMFTTFHTVKFYNKPLRKFDEDDVTIAAQVSPNRLARIVEMAIEWQGPMSVALYVYSDEDVEELDRYLVKYPALRDVGIHLLYYNETRYPVNNLRNLAVEASLTPWVLILDADFVTSGGMLDYLNSVVRGSDHKTAYIIPAFSTTLPPTKIPRTKRGIISALIDGDAAVVNKNACYKCHNVTDYHRWYFALEPYQVWYRWVYEPFLLFYRDEAPPFREEFKGYGFDKNTWVYNLALLGWDFYVLPEAFITHQPHERTHWDGNNVDEQLGEMLSIVCGVVLDTKQALGYPVDESIYGEPPLLGKGCETNQKWF
eukprot:TRINITY_DN2715_c0_g1_i3.p1 TRINITY_DN2715_c0_g1~~TRINITY_DN2715_c0_g1_i3.p1  ORF type:complete len:417 (-),score=68.30 TRINITY_DN2715_c0_g1_i3:8-1120(-)